MFINLCLKQSFGKSNGLLTQQAFFSCMFYTFLATSIIPKGQVPPLVAGKRVRAGAVNVTAAVAVAHSVVGVDGGLPGLVSTTSTPLFPVSRLSINCPCNCYFVL